MNNHELLLASNNRGQVGVNAGEISVLHGFFPHLPRMSLVSYNAEKKHRGKLYT